MDYLIIYFPPILFAPNVRSTCFGSLIVYYDVVNPFIMNQLLLRSIDFNPCTGSFNSRRVLFLPASYTVQSRIFFFLVPFTISFLSSIFPVSRHFSRFNINVLIDSKAFPGSLFPRREQGFAVHDIVILLTSINIPFENSAKWSPLLLFFFSSSFFHLFSSLFFSSTTRLKQTQYSSFFFPRQSSSLKKKTQTDQICMM